MNKSLRIGLVLLVVLLLASLGAWLYVTGTPQYSLRQVAKAVEGRDRAMFERYVDVERTVGSAIDGVMDAFLRQAIDSASQSDNPFAVIGATLGAAMIENVKPAAVRAATKTILDGVESGSIADAFREAGGEGQAVGPLNLTSSASLDDARFMGVTRVDKSNGHAVVGLAIRYEVLDTTLVLHIEMEKGDGRWRIVGVKDLGEFLSTLVAIEQARLAEINRRIKQEMDRFVEVVSLESRIRSRGWFQNDLEVAIRVGNLSDLELRNVVLRLTTADEMAESLEFPPIRSIAPGEDGVANRVIDDIRFYWLYNALVRGAKDAVKVEVLSLDVRRGGGWETLALYPTWAAYRESVRK